MKLGFVILAAALTTALPLHADSRPTASFRSGHAEIKEHLAHLDSMAGSLAAKDDAGRKQTASSIVKFLTDHILEHAAWEEAHLYPVVDGKTHAGQHPFTGTMRYEHKIIGRMIGELQSTASKPTLDAARFTRDTDRVLGLISAHFEEEEEVLLPVLDASMTREEVEKALGSGEAHR